MEAAVQATNELQKELRSWKKEFIRKLLTNNDVDNVDIERVNILQNLCQQGADLNYLEKERGFPCIPEVFYSERLIQFFIDKGMNINSQDENGDTALHLALRYVLFGEDFNPNEPILLNMFSRKVPKVIIFLVEKMADPNVINLRGENPLFTLAKEPYRPDLNIMRIGEMLVARGSNIQTWNSSGESMLHQHRKTFCIPCHFIEESDVNVRTKLYSQTPLMIAAYEGKYEFCCQHLIDIGADINAKDLQGYTALHHAILMSAMDCAEVLVDLGADPNMKSESGRDVYELAICSGIQFLHGAEPRKQVEILEMAGAYKITRYLNLFSAFGLWHKAMGLCQEFHLEPSEEFTNNLAFLSQNPNNVDEMYLEGLNTVARLSPEIHSKFWKMLCFAHNSNSSKVFLTLNFLSDELKRVEDFASLEVTDLKALANLNIIFSIWLESLIQNGRKDEIRERIEQLHSIAKLVLACFNKVIHETNKAKKLPHFREDAYVHTCKTLAIIHSNFDDIIPETAFNDNKQLLRNLINLDLRDEDGNALMHLALKMLTGEQNTRKSKYEFIDTLLDFGFVDVKALNLHGFEPVQTINWDWETEIDEQSLKVYAKMGDMGSHIDAKNSLDGPTLREIFQKEKPYLAFHYDKLQCMCARVLIRSLVPFRERVPKAIADFILMHSKIKITPAPQSTCTLS